MCMNMHIHMILVNNYSRGTRYRYHSTRYERAKQFRRHDGTKSIHILYISRFFKIDNFLRTMYDVHRSNFINPILDINIMAVEFQYVATYYNIYININPYW